MDTAFPGGRYDDQVDSTTQLLIEADANWQVMTFAQPIIVSIPRPDLLSWYR